MTHAAVTLQSLFDWRPDHEETGDWSVMPPRVQSYSMQPVDVAVPKSPSTPDHAACQSGPEENELLLVVALAVATRWLVHKLDRQ